MDACKLQIKLFVEANTKEEAQQCVGNIWTELKDCIVQVRVETAEVYWKMEGVKKAPDIFVIRNQLTTYKNAYSFLEDMGYEEIQPMWEVSLW